MDEDCNRTGYDEKDQTWLQWSIERWSDSLYWHQLITDYYLEWTVSSPVADFFLFLVGEAIRLEHVEIPNVVAVGESAHLVCDVDLEQGDLYSVKWYKDSEEFYDWKPWRDPTSQTYHVEGVHVDVSSPILHLSHLSSTLLKPSFNSL